MNDKELDILLDRFASDEITEAEQQRLIDRLASLPEPEIPDMLGERLAETIDTLAATDLTRRAITPVHSRRIPSAARHHRHSRGGSRNHHPRSAPVYRNTCTGLSHPA